MSTYSVQIVAMDLRQIEPVTVAMDDRTLRISSVQSSIPPQFADYEARYKRSKVLRHDLVLFCDDLSSEQILGFAKMINRLSIKNGDTWWGILAYGYNTHDEESWAKLGSRYYGPATGVEELAKFLSRLHSKPANYDRYTRGKKLTT